MKINLKGIIVKATTKEIEKRKGEFVQLLILRKAPVLNDFEEEIVKESFFELQNYISDPNKTPDKVLDIVDIINKKVDCDLYLNSSTSTKDGQTNYFLRLNLVNIKFIG
jgi:hypothetical protein